MNTRNRKAGEQDILTQAIDALATETGIKVDIQDIQVLAEDTDYQADALITIGQNKDIYVETKRHAQHTNIGTIINLIHRLPNRAILVADYINPNMADKLKQENIQFIDTAGNTFINLKPLYIFITGKKQTKERDVNTQDYANRAFEPKGLMVTYAFLINPDLLNRPYREIAAATDVALGTVGCVIKALKAGRYIHDEARTKYRRITNYHALLDRWVAAWPEKLKPKHLLGTFATDDRYWWKNIEIENYEGCWGGETAAALYTNFLKPEITTVYIPKNNFAKLIRDIRLRKVGEFDNGTSNIVKIYTPFWPVDNVDEFTQAPKDQNNRFIEIEAPFCIRAEPGLVNPILVYADLIGTGDTRNIEVARKLYDERIARHFNEN